jgi:hypothetical protein
MIDGWEIYVSTVKGAVILRINITESEKFAKKIIEKKSLTLQ